MLLYVILVLKTALITCIIISKYMPTIIFLYNYLNKYFNVTFVFNKKQKQWVKYCENNII